MYRTFLLFLLLLATPVQAQIENIDIQAETIAQKEVTKTLQPFGAQLFNGQLEADQANGLNEDYVLQEGDTVNLSVWGATEFTGPLVVDSQGNIFIPTVGPVQVAGTKLSELNNTVEDAVSRVYRDGVNVYTNLSGTQPISVFVTGQVEGPGRYSGVATDTILHYLDRAGGVDPVSGSYRHIDVIRNDVIIESVDLYNFLLHGTLPSVQLIENDTILVRPQLETVTAEGDVRNEYRYELLGDGYTGENLLKISNPYPDVTNVSISGTRNGTPFMDYISLPEFKNIALSGGDKYTFSRGKIGELLTVKIEGQHNGPREMVVPLGTELEDLLDYIPVDPDIVHLPGIQLHRKSVARQQKQSLEEALDRLEKKVLSGRTISTNDAANRATELQFVQQFIARAKTYEPEGRVVVASRTGLKKVMLEDQDKIVIPAETSLVLVNGEVYDPTAIVYEPGKDAMYYINKAGGYSDFADKGEILIFKANGESIPVGKTRIEPGDEIVVLPKLRFSTLQITKEILDVFSKAVLSVAVPIELFDD